MEPSAGESGLSIEVDEGRYHDARALESWSQTRFLCYALATGRTDTDFMTANGDEPEACGKAPEPRPCKRAEALAAHACANAAYYRMRGKQRHMQADLDGALADFDAAIALDPAFAAAYVDRGAARFLKTDVAGALADYDMGARLDPRQPSLHHMRALARRAAGDLAGAYDDLCAALHVDGETADIYNDRGRVSMESGDFAGAGADYERAAILKVGICAGLIRFFGFSSVRAGW